MHVFWVWISRLFMNWFKRDCCVASLIKSRTHYNPYFFVIKSTGCFCGNVSAPYGLSTNCVIDCAGNSGDKCGGPYALSTYTTQSKPSRKKSIKFKLKVFLFNLKNTFLLFYNTTKVFTTNIFLKLHIIYRDSTNENF